MMKYRNKKNGAVIETACKVSGEHWEKVTAALKNKPSAEKKSDDEEKAD